jgi:CubicO group peptidase (beta-lactamase class C family)
VDSPPVGDDAIFLIASITKPIVATGLLLLVERGLIALDDRVEVILGGRHLARERRRRAEDKSDHTLLTTRDHLNQFQLPPVGIALVRQGWLGWPWVETINPVHQK